APAPRAPAPAWHDDASAFTPLNPAPAGRERLELAVAYLDLGDVDTARTLLREVLAGQDPAARDEAAHLLSEIGCRGCCRRWASNTTAASSRAGRAWARPVRRRCRPRSSVRCPRWPTRRSPSVAPGAPTPASTPNARWCTSTAPPNATP